MLKEYPGYTIIDGALSPLPSKWKTLTAVLPLCRRLHLYYLDRSRCRLRRSRAYQILRYRYGWDWWMTQSDRPYACRESGILHGCRDMTFAEDHP